MSVRTDLDTIEVKRLTCSRISLHPRMPESSVLTLETATGGSHYWLRSDELLALGTQMIETAGLLAERQPEDLH